MADIPKPKPVRRWFEGITRWKYVMQAYYAGNGTKFPEFHKRVDDAGKDPKQQVRVELGGIAIYLLGIKDSPNQRREDHPRP